ncbi:hypothetical protein VTN31DRAFT_2396 [Thermomyces dupontii]|uniref:uncharacterized protein n=1 Tax=Talaromyces thermophilus TaxID=28565 RepID=UPI0037448894
MNPSAGRAAPQSAFAGIIVYVSGRHKISKNLMLATIGGKRANSRTLRRHAWSCFDFDMTSLVRCFSNYG